MRASHSNAVGTVARIERDCYARGLDDALGRVEFELYDPVGYYTHLAHAALKEETPDA